jgi:hypothetical protein
MGLYELIDSHQKNYNNASKFKANLYSNINEYINDHAGDLTVSNDLITLKKDEESGKDILTIVGRSFDIEYQDNFTQGLNIYFSTKLSGKKRDLFNVIVIPDGIVTIVDHEHTSNIDEGEKYTKYILDTLVKLILDNPYG